MSQGKRVVTLKEGHGELVLVEVVQELVEVLFEKFKDLVFQHLII